MISAAPYIQPEWQALRPLVGIGGSTLFVSALLYFLNMLLTCVASHAQHPRPQRLRKRSRALRRVGPCLIAGRPWLILTAVLLLLAYGHPLFHLVSNTPLNVAGMRVW